jgi:hypothetical protein
MAVRTNYRQMTTPTSRPSRSVLPFAHGHVLTSWPPFLAPQVHLRIGIRQRPRSSSIRVQRTDLIIHRFTIWICGREFAIESLPGYARYTEISPFWKKHLDKSFDASMLFGKAWAPAFWCCTLDDARPSTLLSAFSSCSSNFHFSFQTTSTLTGSVAEKGYFRKKKNQYMGRDDTHELYTPLTAMRDIILILFFLFT